MNKIIQKVDDCILIENRFRNLQANKDDIESQLKNFNTYLTNIQIIQETIIQFLDLDNLIQNNLKINIKIQRDNLNKIKNDFLNKYLKLVEADNNAEIILLLNNLKNEIIEVEKKIIGEIAKTLKNLIFSISLSVIN